MPILLFATGTFDIDDIQIESIKQHPKIVPMEQQTRSRPRTNARLRVREARVCRLAFPDKLVSPWPQDFTWFWPVGRAEHAVALELIDDARGARVADFVFALNHARAHLLMAHDELFDLVI